MVVGAVAVVAWRPLDLYMFVAFALFGSFVLFVKSHGFVHFVCPGICVNKMNKANNTN